MPIELQVFCFVLSIFSTIGIIVVFSRNKHGKAIVPTHIGTLPHDYYHVTAHWGSKHVMVSRDGPNLPGQTQPFYLVCHDGLLSAEEMEVGSGFRITTNQRGSTILVRGGDTGTFPIL